MTGLEVVGGILVALIPIAGVIIAYALRRKTRAEKAADASERLRKDGEALEAAVRAETGDNLSRILDGRLRDLDALLVLEPPAPIDGGKDTAAEGSTVPLSGPRK